MVLRHVGVRHRHGGIRSGITRSKCVRISFFFLLRDAGMDVWLCAIFCGLSPNNDEVITPRSSLRWNLSRIWQPPKNAQHWSYFSLWKIIFRCFYSFNLSVHYDQFALSFVFWNIMVRQVCREIIYLWSSISVSNDAGHWLQTMVLHLKCLHGLHCCLSARDVRTWLLLYCTFVLDSAHSSVAGVMYVWRNVKGVQFMRSQYPRPVERSFCGDFVVFNCYWLTA